MKSADTDREPVRLPEELSRVHMVGIGGAGMSGLARILLSRGGLVSGSDAKDGRAVLALRTRGAQVRVGHSADALDLLPGGPTVVVTTHAAIPKDNPELVAARERGIPILYRPRVLAMLMRDHRTVLIAGTHGKTSTTSIVVVALQHCGLDPSFAVGGELNESGTNAHDGSGEVFVAEADESDGSLLEYQPDIAVITNIEADHLDHFGTAEAYTEVFDRFTERIRPGGTLVLCLDDPGAAALGGRCGRSLTARGVQVLGYGQGRHADLAPEIPLVVELLEYHPDNAGGSRIRLNPPLTAGTEPVERTLRQTVPGRHMVLNSLGAVIATAVAGAPEGADLPAAIEGVESFTGVHRRFEYRGTEAGVTVYDDYAHHPTEVAAVLTAARDLLAGRAGPGRLLAVFQPHLYSRTAEFATEFAAALDLADLVVVADVFGAREQPQPGVSGRLIADAVTRPATFCPVLSELPTHVAGLARPGDVIITLGAGDITMQAPEILAELGTAEPHR